MELSFWALALLITKLGIYLGYIAAVGGMSIVFMLDSTKGNLGSGFRQYLWTLSSLALISTGLAFFVQVGALANSGWSGMWHTLFRSILWNSTVGESTLMRIIGFALMLIVLTAFHIPAKIKQRTWFRALLFALWLIALYALMASFSLIGHTAELNIRVQIALSLHVLVVAWWMGGLWPLWLSCKELDSEGLHSLMHRFGQLAQVAVAVLIATGVFLAIQLLGSVSALWLTDYGQIFLLKLVGVSAILLIGLYHKVRLTPELISKPESSYRLARSIQIEMFVGLLVLLTTAVLTTLVGPSHAL